jgi:hypothetical protein
MAQSWAHKFGQIVGETLERALEPVLRTFAAEHGRYLDQKGPRPTRSGRKVAWTDTLGNTHDLDYVLERGGGPDHIGAPVAFIEVAWRRYTKHSRNKAQEIQAAILPLRERYREAAPFIGVVLAGVFTPGAVQQLRANGFIVLHFPYEHIVAAFRTAGVNADLGENARESEIRSQVSAWRRLRPSVRESVARQLVDARSTEMAEFMEALRRAVLRRIELIRILPLHGVALECTTVEDAIRRIRRYDDRLAPSPVVRYEIEVRYSNGDRIAGQFQDKETAVRFLEPFGENAG